MSEMVTIIRIVGKDSLGNPHSVEGSYPTDSLDIEKVVSEMAGQLRDRIAAVGGK